MTDFQQRVVVEKRELDERIQKLEAFISNSPVFPTLPTDERFCLEAQLTLMRGLSNILGIRILKFDQTLDET